MGRTQQRAVVADEGQVVEDIKAFLVRFEEFKEQQIQAIGPIKRFLSEFRHKRHIIEKRQQNWEVTVAPRFNVFQALRIERRETKLHEQVSG